MILRVDLLQGTEVFGRTEVFHGTEASCVSELTFGADVPTRLREPRPVHETHESASCVPAALPPAHVCAAKLEQRERNIGRTLSASALPALTVQDIRSAAADAQAQRWARAAGRR